MTRNKKPTPPSSVTVAQLIVELQKLPPDASVFTATAFGLRPAHVLAYGNGTVHVLGLLTDTVLGES